MTCDNLKSHKVCGAEFRSTDNVFSNIRNLLHLIDLYPRIVRPAKDVDKWAKDILCGAGFILYPTVKNTTLIYDEGAGCFIKILHPLTIKKKILSRFADPSRRICHYAEFLNSCGVKLPRIAAYGSIGGGKLPFFITEKVEGQSLHEIVINQRKTLSDEVYMKIIEQIALLHRSGYWFRDLHPAHIFIHNNDVSGLIDIDGIRRNRPFRLKNLAKDIAGLNHPNLKISSELKWELLNHYISLVDIRKRDDFSLLVKHYSGRRWKGTIRNMDRSDTGDNIINVLHVVMRLPVGGVENMLLKVVKGYNKKKYHPVICCIKEEGAVAEELRISGYEVIYLDPEKRNGLEWSAIKYLRKLIKERNIHVLRTHQYHANMYGRIAGVLAGVPVIIPSFHNLYRSPDRPKFHRRAMNYVLGFFSDALVAVSHTIASDIIRYDRVNSDKISVIYNGVEINKFSIAVSKKEARETFDLPEDTTIIGSVGRLTNQKGHSELLEAAARFDNVCVAIAGEGPLRGFLRKRADSMNVKCIFTGELPGDQVPVFLKAVDIFCFPSLWEGLPSSLVEAMAAGLPVVVSDIPPHRELIDDSGLFALPADSEALFIGLEQLVNSESLRNELGSKARERAKDFAIENTVHAYENLFEKILSRKSIL